MVLFAWSFQLRVCSDTARIIRATSSLMGAADVPAVEGDDQIAQQASAHVTDEVLQSGRRETAKPALAGKEMRHQRKILLALVGGHVEELVLIARVDLLAFLDLRGGPALHHHARALDRALLRIWPVAGVVKAAAEIVHAHDVLLAVHV